MVPFHFLSHSIQRDRYLTIQKYEFIVETVLYKASNYKFDLFRYMSEKEKKKERKERYNLNVNAFLLYNYVRGFHNEFIRIYNTQAGYMFFWLKKLLITMLLLINSRSWQWRELLKFVPSPRRCGKHVLKMLTVQDLILIIVCLTTRIGSGRGVLRNPW